MGRDPVNEHKPGLHCHHEKPEMDCTMCTYRAMEQAAQETIELLLELERETAATSEETGEDGPGAGLDDPPYRW